MNRRAAAVVIVLAIVALVVPLRAEAQQARKVWRIGYLTLGATVPPSLFVERLREAGYVEGQNVKIDFGVRMTSKVSPCSAFGSMPVKFRKGLSAELRENFALLARMYHDHFQTLQESGLEPKSAQKVKLDETRRVFHDTFTFLEPEQAIRLKKLEDLAEKGELPILEFYKSAEGLFKLEQEAAERAALEGRDE